MAKKRQSLESKLGTWTDQASLTRSAAPVVPAAVPPPAPLEPEKTVTQAAEQTIKRQRYEVARGLMERITEASGKYRMTQSEVVGYLLTWALDQVESGGIQMPTK